MLSPTMSVSLSGVTTVPFGKLRSSAAIHAATVGFDREEVRLAPRLAAVHVEAEVADVGAAAAVDDHVVAVRTGASVERSACTTSAPSSNRSTLPIDHRHDEHATVGQPSEPAG